jgi:hypothetical protein
MLHTGEFMSKSLTSKINELLKAIKRKCKNCSGGIREEVEKCPVVDCPLHAYRRSADIELMPELQEEDLKPEPKEAPKPADSKALDDMLDDW